MKHLIYILLFTGLVFAGGGFVGASVGDHKALIVDIEKEVNYTAKLGTLTRTFKTLSIGMTVEKFPTDKAFGFTFGKITDVNIYNNWGVLLSGSWGVVYLFDHDRFAISSGWKAGFYYGCLEFYAQSRLNTFTYKTYQKALTMTGIGMGLRL